MAAKAATEPRTRPFPWPCPNCLSATVVPTVIDYTAKVKHDGVVHELHMPALEVPRCTQCGETIITTAVDERINEALRSRLRCSRRRKFARGFSNLGCCRRKWPSGSASLRKRSRVG